VTDVTADNLDYIKEMLTFSEIKHLEGMKGNFEVSDEKEYVAVATLKEAHPIPQLIFSNVPEIVEQQQFVFDSFWDKGIPAELRITEIERGIIPSVTNILTDYEKAEKKEFDMIRDAKKDIKIIYSTPYAFHIQEKSGTLELLKEMADEKENLNINLLVPIDQYIKKSLSLALLSNTINKNIQIYNIEPSINVRIKSIVTDRKESLVIEIKELEVQDMEPTTGFAIYSNSLPTVLTYSSVFEMILNQSILSEELRHEGEIKDEFINTAAHELRTPTQAITGYSELNDEQLDDLLNKKETMTEEEQRKSLMSLRKHQENISRNAMRLNNLINNLLDVARFDSSHKSEITLHKEKVDLVKEINDIIASEFSQKIRDKDIKINFINNYLLGDHCWVYSDQSRVNQVLTNLVDNAIKFSKKGDSINIMIKNNSSFESSNTTETEINRSEDETENIQNNQGYSVSEQQEEGEKGEENNVYVSISDSGKGISSKMMPKLFEKFVTDSDFGTGLGLFLSKKLVEAHGGRIWAFNNSDGIGSTFVFSLPKIDSSGNQYL